MTIKLVNGKRYTIKDSDEVKCEVHNIATTWGALDPIQQFAVESNLDTSSDCECLLLSRREPIKLERRNEIGQGLGQHSPGDGEPRL